MRVSVVSVVLITLLAFAASPGGADTFERVRESGILKIGYRADAVPYSYRDKIGEPAGYSVELCRAIAAAVGKEIGREVRAEYIEVTAENRFDAVQGARIDILCGATTATISRRARVDFSIPTFVDGASVLFRKDGPSNFAELSGHKVGVRKGTTTEVALKNSLEELSVDAEIVPITDHKDGLQKLASGQVSAYFGDRAILTFLMLSAPSAADLRLSDRYFTQEPYALALERGDSDFRLVVDRTLSRIYRSGAIERYFANAFGGAKPSNFVSALYVISGLPE
jgi:polar amino acid transport system substrate-binding protein/glutamate/aspartate transport system substrate-binding protein